jgi:hypothetical protein
MKKTSTVVLLGLGLSNAQAHEVDIEPVREEPPIQRIEQIRQAFLKALNEPRDLPSSLTYDRMAQYWPNWPNFSNWNNWGNGWRNF